jgi:hypothetical protein
MSDILTIATTSNFVWSNQWWDRISLGDGSYLMIWNDGWGTGFTASYNGGNENRIARIWKAQTTSLSTDISLWIATSSVTLPAGTKLSLIVSPDTNFTDSDTIVQTYTSWDYIYTNTMIPDWYYLTFSAENSVWSLCIEAPDHISSWATITASSQIVEFQSDYFKVDDQIGWTDWYYTTLSLTSLTGSLWGTIPLSAIEIKADPIITLSGASNPAIMLDTDISTYASSTSPITFIKRNLWSGGGILWTYWSKVRLKINIPAYQSIGTYAGAIVYTLYEN